MISTSYTRATQNRALNSLSSLFAILYHTDYNPCNLYIHHVTIIYQLVYLFFQYQQSYFLSCNLIPFKFQVQPSVAKDLIQLMWRKVKEESRNTLSFWPCLDAFVDTLCLPELLLTQDVQLSEALLEVCRTHGLEKLSFF